MLRLIAGGRTLKEIAADMGIGEKTAGTYRTRISEKMALGTQVQLTRYAVEHHLLD